MINRAVLKNPSLIDRGKFDFYNDSKDTVAWLRNIQNLKATEIADRIQRKLDSLQYPNGWYWMVCGSGSDPVMRYIFEGWTYFCDPADFSAVEHTERSMIERGPLRQYCSIIRCEPPKPQ